MVDIMINFNAKGYKDISNECDYCKQPLLPSLTLDSYIN